MDALVISTISMAIPISCMTITYLQISLYTKIGRPPTFSRQLPSGLDLFNPNNMFSVFPVHSGRHLIAETDFFARRHSVVGSMMNLRWFKNNIHILFLYKRK
jgi:hypothetical protein